MSQHPRNSCWIAVRTCPRCRTSRGIRKTHQYYDIYAEKENEATKQNIYIESKPKTYTHIHTYVVSTVHVYICISGMHIRLHAYMYAYINTCMSNIIPAREILQPALRLSSNAIWSKHCSQKAAIAPAVPVRRADTSKRVVILQGETKRNILHWKSSTINTEKLQK